MTLAGGFPAERGIALNTYAVDPELRAGLAKVWRAWSFDTASGVGAFGQNDVEFNLFNTNRQLSALQTAVAMLAERGRRVRCQ